MTIRIVEKWDGRIKGDTTLDAQEQEARAVAAREFIDRIHEQYRETDEMARRVAVLATEAELPFDIRDYAQPAQSWKAQVLAWVGISRPSPLQLLPRETWFVRTRSFMGTSEDVFLTPTGQLLSYTPHMGTIPFRRVGDETAPGMHVMSNWGDPYGSFPSQQEHLVQGGLGPNGNGYGLREIERRAQFVLDPPTQPSARA